MKPVVSSLVALALAIAPLAAMASPEKSTHHKPAHHKKIEKVEKDKADKAEVADKDKDAAKDKDRPVLARVKHAKKDGKIEIQRVKLVDPHKGEPKTADKGLVNASLKSKPADLPKLPPAPSASTQKAQKSGTEKAAPRKASKKSEPADDGQPERDEEQAELVARIRGTKLAKGATPKKAEAPCAKDPVEIVRGPEVDRFELTKCDGTVAPLAIEHLSILVRPGTIGRPTESIEELAKKKGAELAHGIRRVDPGLALRLQAIVDHFAEKGAPAKLDIVSGYRPTSVGSLHQSGRAIDFRLEGAKNEDVVAFCKTLDDTGCGFYPNSSFVHVDVREAGAGHVSWIDASGPGEMPRYVSEWPAKPRPAADDVVEKTSARFEPDATEPPVDEHPGDVGEITP